MKKKLLLLTTLLLATTLAFTACGKAEETPVEEESAITMEESTVEEETETETVVETETEEETFSMTQEEIRAFLEEVRDMDYESYTYRDTHYFTNVTDAEGNPMDDHVNQDFYFHVDAEGNILVEGTHLTNEDSELTDDTHTTHYIFVDGTHASNLVATQEDFDWDVLKEDIVYGQYLNYAKFFDGWSDLSIEELAAKAVVSEYNNRPVLYIQNMTNDTEDSLLQTVYPEATKYTGIEGSLSYDTYLYLDIPGEYVSAESFSYTDTETGTTYKEHWDYELSKVNSTELPEVPENFIKY